MAQFRRRNPYDPVYALPANVLAEPPGRGTYTTAYVVRRHYDEAGCIPRPWQGGYAIPDYIVAEYPGQNAAITHWERRKWIPQLIPPALGDAEEALGDIVEIGAAGKDPLRDYGIAAASHVLGAVRRAPFDQRVALLETLLDAVKPGLTKAVRRRAESLEESGIAAGEALRQALAIEMSQGFAKELEALAYGHLPAPRSLSGLALYGDAEALAALEGVWGAIKGAAKAVGSAVKTAVVKTGGAIKTATTATGGAIKKGAIEVKDFAKEAVKELQDLACKMAPQVAATGGVAGAGATVATKLCNGEVAPAPVVLPSPQPPQQGLPGWVIPVGVGALALGGAYLLVRKR